MSVMDPRLSVLGKAIARDERGAVLVEVSVVMTIMLVFLLGSIEFLFVFYQRNAAAKAVQIGARLASVSDPVAIGLNGLSTAVLGPGVSEGSAMPDFSVTCDGSTSRCMCSSGTCPAELAYNAAAMNTLVFGRGSASCGDAKSFYDTGMCDIFARITPANVIITYAQSGMGFAGRPGGPAPTITISLRDLRLQFFFLRSLARFDDLQIPPSTMSMTAEDLSSRAPTF
jgi:TadE-like protein